MPASKRARKEVGKSGGIRSPLTLSGCGIGSGSPVAPRLRCVRSHRAILGRPVYRRDQLCVMTHGSPSAAQSPAFHRFSGTRVMPVARNRIAICAAATPAATPVIRPTTVALPLDDSRCALDCAALPLTDLFMSFRHPRRGSPLSAPSLVVRSGPSDRSRHRPPSLSWQSTSTSARGEAP